MRICAESVELALMAASSGGPGGGGTDGQSGAVDGSSITIGTFSPLAPQYKLWAEAYMKEYPDRKVEIVPVSEDFVQYQHTLATQRISGTMPDLVFNVDFLANTSPSTPRWSAAPMWWILDSSCTSQCADRGLRIPSGGRTYAIGSGTVQALGWGLSTGAPAQGHHPPTGRSGVSDPPDTMGL